MFQVPLGFRLFQEWFERIFICFGFNLNFHPFGPDSSGSFGLVAFSFFRIRFKLSLGSFASIRVEFRLFLFEFRLTLSVSGSS